MSDFRTITPIEKSSFDLSYQDQIALMGSCFSNNIASKLSARKFKTLSNPYGIVFNPISLFNSLHEIIDRKEYKESDLIFHNELEHSLNHHSEFSHPEPKEVLNKINTRISEARDFLQTAKVLYLTLGTAWVYTYDGEIVANCHKIPNHQFERKLLGIQDIEHSFKLLWERIKVFNPDLNIVFTLSPVRHLKDGAQENSLSKAVLRFAIHSILEFNSNISYFPSYEIMMDDLRDYRFYAKDMVHPSEQAVDYIWEKFGMTYFEFETLDIMARIEKLDSAINHKPRFPNSEAHQKHLAYIQKEKEELRAYYKL